MSKFLKKIAELHIGSNTPEENEKEAQNARIASYKLVLKTIRFRVLSKHAKKKNDIRRLY